MEDIPPRLGVVRDSMLKNPLITHVRDRENEFQIHQKKKRRFRKIGREKERPFFSSCLLQGRREKAVLREKKDSKKSW